MHAGQRILTAFVGLLGWFVVEARVSGCIWDSDTMLQERWTRPKMAAAILGDPPKPPESAPLRQRIAALKTAPRENDASWWNDLAGAHLRLGEAAAAAALLESVTNRFATDYGVHANLGTAYHLLGRYADAEREIARDLELNPDAHFGWEKYHLALLQYLARDKEYQRRHVYVDEFTRPFLKGQFLFLRPEDGLLTNRIPAELTPEAIKDFEAMLAESTTHAGDPRLRSLALSELAGADPAPAYRLKWNLGRDPNLESGLIYMAGLNPQQPACFVMLGVKSLANRDLNLAAAAFDRAIALGSPQVDILSDAVRDIRKHIGKAQRLKIETSGVVGLVFLAVGLAIGYYLVDLAHRRKPRLTAGESLAGSAKPGQL